MKRIFFIFSDTDILHCSLFPFDYFLLTYMNMYSIHTLSWNYYPIICQSITFKKEFCVGHIVPPHSEEAQMHFLYVFWYFEDEIMVFEKISPQYGVLVRISSLLAAVIAWGFWLSCVVNWSVEKKSKSSVAQCHFLIISPPSPVMMACWIS